MGWVVLSSKVQSLAIKMIGCLCTSFLLRRLPMREIIIMRNCSLARRSLGIYFPYGWLQISRARDRHNHHNTQQSAMHHGRNCHGEIWYNG
jgi:hypothetical protein